jgi:ectoine hydroxylase-related dioxygenase (phytanoyl-CoA dioxygenase family)
MDSFDLSNISSDLNYIGIKNELEEKGYCVVPNIISSNEIETALDYFHKWVDTNPDMKEKHKKVPHGIMRFYEVAHQLHAWYIRTRKNVQNVFKTIWDTDELVVSYDGCCWLSKDINKKDNIWTHVDQAPNNTEFACYQSFVALTTNITRTLVVYEGSHKLYKKYVEEKGLNHKINWQLIDHDYLKSIQHLKRVICAKAGSLVIWDSRTFHQNQYGNPEERIVQYVSYLPKKGRSQKMYEKRLKYLHELRTTSHWAYPVKVNGLQPQTFKNKDNLIDYSQLQKPDLEDLMSEIMRLV